MKIVMIYRPPYPGLYYSIEILFHSIAYELRDKAEIIEYTTRSRKKTLIDAWRLRKLKADIYHVTGDIDYMISFLPRNKTILTMHDISYYTYHLKGFKKVLFKWLWYIIPINYAAIVTSISDATINTIREKLKISKNIISIPNCYNSIYKPQPRKFNQEKPTILQIGTMQHKNVERVIEALSGIKCQLVIIGNLNENHLKLLKHFQIDYSNLVGISLEEIYQNYIRCDLVTFISLAEGFGVPIIEAQAVGRAVITTNYAPMSMVAGDAAELVDPLDVTAIRQSILKLINQADYREQMITAGFENVKRYSIEAIAAQYLRLYQQLYSANN